MSLIQQLYSQGAEKTAFDQRVEAIGNDQRTLDFFHKVAAEQGVDLGKMDDASLEAEYANFCAKIAEAQEEEEKEKGKDAPPPSENAEKKKEAAAQDVAYFFNKIAAYKEADEMGRVMAHAVIDELRKVAAGDQSDSGSVAAKIASTLALQSVGHMPNLDNYAFDVALEICKQANMSDEQVADVGQKIAALYNLGKFDISETKIAAAANFDGVVQVRALEQLEQVGVPVNWDNVFGG